VSTFAGGEASARLSVERVELAESPFVMLIS